MDITDLRADFTRISGRADLNEAAVDRYVNRGQQFLDQRVDNKRSVARYFRDMPPGSTGLTFSSDCRAIHVVYVMDLESRTEVEKVVDHHALKAAYPNLPSGIDAGRPQFYSVAYIRQSPDDAPLGGLPFFGGYRDVVPDSHDWNGIVWLAPTDITYVFEVWGRWNSEALTTLKPSSWWSTNAYSTLLHAALYQLEVDYRNTEGSKDWLNTITLDLADISFDDAEEDAATLTRMEG